MLAALFGGSSSSPSSPTSTAVSSADGTSSAESSDDPQALAKAEAALEAAEACLADDDSEGARRNALESLNTGCILANANALIKHLDKFGPGTAAANAVANVINAKNDCAVLGIMQPAHGEAVSPTRLKKAYKHMALLLHPDRNRSRGAEDAFKRLQEAYASLDPNAPKPKVSRRHAEAAQRYHDRGWYARGVDPRHGQTATRNKRPTHLDPQPKRRANGKVPAATKPAVPRVPPSARKATTQRQMPQSPQPTGSATVHKAGGRKAGGSGMSPLNGGVGPRDGSSPHHNASSKRPMGPLEA